MTPDPAIATAADYADALITARRAKNVLTLILVLVVALQLLLFIGVRMGYVQLPATAGGTVTVATTEPTLEALNQPSVNTRISQGLEYLIDGSVFLGTTLSIVLAMTVLLIVKIMLVGRLIGVGRVTSAYVWCLVLCVLLFPWHAFLAGATFSGPDFKIPGVLYNWDELLQTARFGNGEILRWARYVAFPFITLIILLMVQAKTSRGLKQALGEVEVGVTTT